jgi:hypothetical protein
VNWVISEFDVASQALKDEHKLSGVSVDDLRRIFSRSDDDDMIESYPVNAAEAALLASYLDHPLALQAGRSYFLQCFAD